MTTPDEARTQIASLMVSNAYAEPIMNWANCEFADVSDDGNVWIETPQTGHWLDDAKLIELAEWLKTGK